MWYQACNDIYDLPGDAIVSAAGLHVSDQLGVVECGDPDSLYDYFEKNETND